MKRTEHEYDTEMTTIRRLCDERPSSVHVTLSERTVTTHEDGTTVTSPWKVVARWSYEPQK